MIKDTILIVTDMIKMGDIMTIILFMFQGKNHTMLIIINILEVMMITIIITTMITTMDTTIITTMITMMDITIKIKIIKVMTYMRMMVI